jgi:KaiC/GvpD/RAD55 family RecA-like ATPase
MDLTEELRRFYLEHVPNGKMEGHLLKAPCPFCTASEEKKSGVMVAHFDPGSFFMGYFRCMNRCTPGGFAPHFARMMGIPAQDVPDYDPDREPFVQDVSYPTNNLNMEIKKFRSLMGEIEYAHFKEFGVSKSVVDEMKIGYNGRYLVYPYFLEDGNCYAARCVLPGKEADSFWHGDEAFFSETFRIFNIQEIERCEDGALFITDGEDNLLSLRELGYPVVCVPSAAELDVFSQERLAHVNHVFLAMNSSPEAQLSARSLATRLGFKSRILRWPSHVSRGYSLSQLARQKGKEFRAAVASMVKASKSFSPFSTPERELGRFSRVLERERGKKLLGLSCGFQKMDVALSGVRGINIMGGQPKAGKSCFFIQISTEMARRKIPVIYYDFENGRQKIYTRTMCRLTRLSEAQIREKKPDPESGKRLKVASQQFADMLPYFRVVTDRKLNPDIMRRQIDFLQHETRTDYTLVVIDSLHKLPFKNLSERRTGIDEWLRHMEAIRDEENVSFLVISELSRGAGGSYSEKPDLGSFKESGDIEYSADNAIIIMPDWDPLAPISSEEKRSTLWLVASRENSPGKIGEYVLEYPFWGFKEL